MKTYNFICNRRMDGDVAYGPGDTRELSAVDAAQLVRSKALSPADEEAQAAMEKLLGADVNNWGIQPARMTFPDADAPAEEKTLTTGAGKAAPAKVVAPKKATAAKKAVAPAKAKDGGAAPHNKADVVTPPANGGQGSQQENAAAGEGEDGEEKEGGESQGGPAQTAAPVITKAEGGAAPAKRR